MRTKAPDKQGDKTFDQLVEALAKHFKSIPSEIVERCKFMSIQEAG